MTDKDILAEASTKLEKVIELVKHTPPSYGDIKRMYLRDLDVLVEQSLGRPCYKKYRYDNHNGLRGDLEAGYHEPKHGIWKEAPHYATNLDDAFKLLPPGEDAEILWKATDGPWHVRVSDLAVFRHAPTMPLAILAVHFARFQMYSTELGAPDEKRKPAE